MSSDQPRRGIGPRPEDEIDDDPTAILPLPKRSASLFGEIREPGPSDDLYRRPVEPIPAVDAPPPPVPTPGPGPLRSLEPAPRPPHSFSNALGWTIVGTLFPGLGLVRGGSRVSGIAALVVWLAGLGGLGYLVYNPRLAARLLTDPLALIIGATLCGVLAILVTGIVIATYTALRPDGIGVLKRIVGALVVGVLCFAVSAPLAFAASAGYGQARLVTSLFRPTESQTRPTLAAGTSGDVWANTPRVNVLLVGAEADGTTDTMIVVSIDTRTGNSVLVAVPRDIAKLPFPTSSPLRTYYPDGYWDGTNGRNPESWANSLWTQLPKKVPANALGATSSLSADALKLGIGEALGLRVDYYLRAEVTTLYTLVDALGGVTMTVGTRIPTDASAVSWIEPGAGRHLDAYQTLWYGWRSGGSEADRMQHRVCVLDAVTRTNPALVLARFAAVADAGMAATTDVDSATLPALLQLTSRMANATSWTLQFADGVDGFVSSDPDYAEVRKKVSAAIAGSVDPATAKVSPAVTVSAACAR